MSPNCGHGEKSAASLSQSPLCRCNPKSIRMTYSSQESVRVGRSSNCGLCAYSGNVLERGARYQDVEWGLRGQCRLHRVFRLRSNHPSKSEDWNGLKTLRHLRSAFGAASQTAVINHWIFRQRLKLAIIKVAVYAGDEYTIRAFHSRITPERAG